MFANRLPRIGIFNGNNDKMNAHKCSEKNVQKNKPQKPLPQLTPPWEVLPLGRFKEGNCKTKNGSLCYRFKRAFKISTDRRLANLPFEWTPTITSLPSTFSPHINYPCFFTPCLFLLISTGSLLPTFYKPFPFITVISNWAPCSALARCNSPEIYCNVLANTKQIPCR